ncbi:MAG: UDP-glucose 4-epimerase GalE [Verrucomicrobiaceae bacterium]|nr:UDP-glucose 4-epimerase GalE [Verrucomicrobiaceae bacterium]
MSQGTLLITGGAGYIGSHTVRHLLEQNERVVVLDNLVFGHRAALPLDRVTFIEGDMADAALVEKLFAEHKPEAVLHFAAFAYVGESVANPLKYYRNNLAAPLTLLETMQRHGCKRFILSSTCASYGDPVRIPIDESHPQAPVNPYGASKWMLERVLRDCDTAWGLKSVFLRYFNASGSHPSGEIGEDHNPETHLIPLVLQAAAGQREHITIFGTDYPTPDGTCIRDYIHVCDLASAHALALKFLREGGDTIAVNLGTGRGFSVKEVIATAEAVTGRKIPVVFGPRRAGDPSELVADPSRAMEILRWQAAHLEPREHIDSAWRWMNGAQRGHYAD